MLHSAALKTAETLLAYLQPACSRIEIKGSIARLKPEPKDIELLAIPVPGQVAAGRPEFGKPIPKVYPSLLDKLLDELEQLGAIYFKKDGPRYKQFRMMDVGIDVDLFLVLPPSQWGVQAVIRTGPAEFGHWMVTRKCKGGALPDNYIVQDGVVGERIRTAKGDARQGEISMPEEIDFLSFCGLGWIEPKDRRPQWGNGIHSAEYAFEPGE
jgi:DNA polymerase/3'-5' exonuclease PolX